MNQLVFGILCILIGGSLAESQWVWPNNNGQDRSNGNNFDKYRKDLYLDASQRESTTRRPVFEQGRNSRLEDLDEYVNPEDARNSLIPQQLPKIAGQRGNPANGILVGPEGPTGFIGRPPHHYPRQNQYPFGRPEFGIGVNELPNQGPYSGFRPGSFAGPGGFIAPSSFLNNGGYSGFGGFPSNYPLGAIPPYIGGIPSARQATFTEGYGLVFPRRPSFTPFNPREINNNAEVINDEYDSRTLERSSNLQKSISDKLIKSN